MKFRFFNTYEPVTTFYRDIVPALVSLGHKVEIVISRGVYRTGRSALEQVIGNIAGVKILKTISMGMEPIGKINKAFLTILYATHAAFHSLGDSPVDLNVFLTQPPLFSLWGYVLRALRGQSYCCICMDVYPHQMIAYGVLRADSPLAKLLTRLSAIALCKADGVIVIGRCMGERLEAMGVLPERIHFVPNWMDEELVYPIQTEDNQLRVKWGLGGKFVVLYAGNMGLAHYFDDILAAAKAFEGREDIAFAFVGGGARHPQVRSEVETNGLTNTLLLPFQDMSRWAEVLGVGDLHFVVFREEHTGLGVPSKTYASLAAGRPILYQGSRDSEIARMVLEEDIGTVVQCGDPAALKGAILKYAHQPDLCRRQGRRARELAEGPYSRAELIKKYIEILTR